VSKKPPTATQADTIQALLDRSKRTDVPIRKTFVQQGKGKVRDPGPIATLCSHHDERALDLYLLLHAAASADPFDVVLSSPTWARAIGLSNSPNARSAVSKAFTRLADLDLVTRGPRAGNKSRMVLLDEGGRDEPYTHPAARKERYLKLPHTYWTDSWHLKLSLPAKVMLLIALSLDDGFPLPVDRSKDWYGISSDTAQRGLAELANLNLINVDEQYRLEPLAPDGYTQDRRFTLKAPFGPLRRTLATVTKLQAG
jgi:hypothetical protein